MAHGFLTPQPVSGDNFWKNAKSLADLAKGLAKLFKKDLRVVNANIKEVRDLLEGKDQKALPPAATKMLKGNQPKGLLPGSPGSAIVPRKGGIVNTRAKSDIVGRNATDIDRKEQKYLGTTDPDVAGGPQTRKGGTFTDFGSTAAAKPLNNTNFFSKAVTEGVDANTGEYLSREARIAAFQKGKVARNPDQGAPPISPDSGADIVAAVNRNTEAIARMIDATKAQTSNDSNLAQQQIQAQETLMSRAAARAEEKALEQGSDLSGFLTPENFAKKKQQEAKKETGSKLKEIIRGPNPFKDDGCGCGIGGGGFDMPTGRGRRSPRARPRARGGGALPMPDFVRPKAGMPGGILRRGGGRALTRGAAMVGGKAAAKGVAKGLGKMGLKKIPGVGAIAGAAFAAERAMKGDWLGAGGELLSGLAGTIPGVGTAVSAGIDAGLMARDAGLTPFARGGIITQPTQGLVGEAGQEGVFPLEGTRGRKTFQMFGEGIMEAQKRAKDEFSKIQAAGLRFYFQNQDGFKFFGNILKTLFAPFLAPLQGLSKLGGGLLNSLLGGNANAATNVSADEQQLTEALIAGEEGLRTKAYKDSEGIWTIGYGQTTLNGRAVQEGDTMSKEEALSGFRANVASHRQRAIDQLGEDRWSKLDPRSRAVLTSLAYNYGSIPDRVLGAAKTGSAEDIAKAMNSLYGDNDGVLKGRRMREQSILRGGTSDRLDKDFLAGGSLAAATSGPMVMSASAGSRAEGTGLATFGETDGGSGRLVNAAGYVHGHFQTNTGTKQDVVNDTASVVRAMLNSGLTDISISDGTTFLPSMSDGEIKGIVERGVAQHTHSGDGRSVDIFVPRGTPVPFPLTDVRNAGNAGRTGILPGTGHTWVGHLTPDSQSGANQSASAHIAAEPDSGGGGGTQVASRPGSSLTAAQKSQMFQNAGMSALSANALTSATPGPVPASPASPNTGTPIMATSAQVASASSAPAGAPTVINNYYGSGGQQQNGVNPNGVTAGIDMNAAGLSAFQDLRIRTIS